MSDILQVFPMILLLIVYVFGIIMQVFRMKAYLIPLSLSALEYFAAFCRCS